MPPPAVASLASLAPAAVGRVPACFLPTAPLLPAAFLIPVFVRAIRVVSVREGISSPVIAVLPAPLARLLPASAPTTTLRAPPFTLLPRCPVAAAVPVPVPVVMVPVALSATSCLQLLLLCCALSLPFPALLLLLPLLAQGFPALVRLLLLRLAFLNALLLLARLSLRIKSLTPHNVLKAECLPQLLHLLLLALCCGVRLVAELVAVCLLFSLQSSHELCSLAGNSSLHLCVRQPFRLQLILQLHQLHLHLPLAIVLQDLLVWLLVCCWQCARPALLELGHRGTAQVELVGLHMATGAGSTRCQDAYAVIRHGCRKTAG